MRNSFYHILLCFVAFILTGACQKPVIELMENPLHGAITLTISADNVPLDTRAATDLSDAEKAISHLDVIIFTANDYDKTAETDETDKLFYHEHVNIPSDGSGTIVLNKLRSEFVKEDTYYVYLIANCTYLKDSDSEPVEPEQMFPLGMTLEKFRALTQYDQDIDLTGSGLTGINNYFLMDGAAYMKGGSESSDITKAPAIQLNDGIENNNTELEVNLRRSAAKILIYITAGDNVVFDNDEMNADNTSKGSARYYFQHLTTQTFLTPPDPVKNTESGKEIDYTYNGMERESGWGFTTNEEYLRLTSATRSNAPEKSGADNKYVSAIEVQGYAYPQDWNHKSVGFDTKLVINIPLWHKTTTGSGESATDDWDFHGNNYYQVPVSKGNRLDRNTLYIVKVTVNAVGSTNFETAETITDVTYDVLNWKDVTVDIGSSEQQKPVFLSLNEHDIPMYQEGSTATATAAPVDGDMTLQFSSSSEVTVEIVNWYYEDADGKRQYRYGTASGNGYNQIPAATNENTNTDENGNSVPAAEKSKFMYKLKKNTDDTYDYDIGKGVEGDREHTVAIYDPAKPNELTQKLELSNLNGTIGIKSTTPSNYAVRYIILKITNKDTDKGVEPQYVKFAHYPPIYVTHTMGWYSYREDFGGTNWQTLMNYAPATYAPTASDTGTQTRLTSSFTNNSSSDNNYDGLSDNWRNGADWDEDENGWVYTSPDGLVGSGWSGYAYYGENSYYNSFFFDSKVYRNNAIYYITWSREHNRTGSNGNYTHTYRYRRSVGLDDDGREASIGTNPRMYHISVSASTKDYTIGVPKRDTEGTTLKDADNQLLVSPSFMVASQLGATQSPGSNLTLGADHCLQYVETYKDADGKVYHFDDWRLPTEAEIRFIIETQYAPNSPLAEVLAGKEYMAANGEGVKNSGSTNSNSSRALRCVRDAFTTPTARTMPVVGSSKYDSENN